MTLRQLFCRQVPDRRDRDSKGRLVFVCDACGKSVLALERTAKERKAMTQRYQPVRVPVAVADPNPKVTPIEQRRRVAK